MNCLMNCECEVCEDVYSNEYDMYVEDEMEDGMDEVDYRVINERSKSIDSDDVMGMELLYGIVWDYKRM